MTQYEKPAVREITPAEVMDRLGINAAIGEAEREASRQLWLANEMGNALDDKDAENARLRAELKYRVHCDADIEVQNKHIAKLEATIADLTAALRAILDQDTVSDEAEHLRHIAAAALARAGKE